MTQNVKIQEPLVKAHDLRRWRRKFKVCGVYFLFKDERVMYVGQSIDVFTRTYGHGTRDWDTFSFLECPEDDLNRLEREYIAFYDPPYNRVHKPKS